jgi:hypothetical protein
VIRSISILAITLLVTACSIEDKYDTGYSDGYASGYNTTCKIRATLIDGDFDNPSYKKGYDTGYKKGSQDCREKK